uniref:Uncharacterized protein n=1 Tax=Eptatretus burgeri TaxID=7764 RepID=A0A8C4WZ56_EPTBU
MSDLSKASQEGDQLQPNAAILVNSTLPCWSKLQSYLKRKEEKHEGSVEVKSEVCSSTTFHILSLLLRLRQCCCHPALLSTVLQKCDLESDGIDASLDEQMSSSFSAPATSEEKGCITLAGKVFNGALFSKTWKSSKVCCKNSSSCCLSCIFCSVCFSCSYQSLVKL